MDALEDAEISLERTSASSIEELLTFVPSLLFKTHHDADSTSQLKTRFVRSRVRSKGLERIVDTLSPFQELPQLLDPTLERLLNPLSDALIQSLSTAYASQSWGPKIRGAKVIVRFLSNEVKYLEPVVNSLEQHLRRDGIQDDLAATSWEEKYLMLLWLSHLVLTPFPLSSAAHSSEPVLEDAQQLKLPEDLGLVSRICSLALSQLSAPGRERDSAVKVLVHLVVRPDMETPRLMDQLLELNQQGFHDRSAEQTSEAGPSLVHERIGAFALLAGIFNAADPKALAPHLLRTTRYVLNITQDATQGQPSVASSAVTRKLIVKILRCATLAALALSTSELPELSQYNAIIDEILEEVIEQLLNLLSDPDTPVRHAASKALSVIALKLDPDMGSEIIEAVIASLDEGVLWPDEQEVDDSKLGSLSKERDLSLVNPLRWQGLMLTLAQLLFRKAPRPDALPSVVNSLLLGLSFEQRTSTGMSVGGPVRDAANFGLWSLSRQYSTLELEAVEISSIQSVASSAGKLSLLQILACELVCSACLDPSGNIRRGSSAALQELIGRHSDTISCGISIVQTVDYHAVSLRSAALTKVATAAAKLDEPYRAALLAGLLGWRGVSATDAESRRWAAVAVGQLAGLDQGIAAKTLEFLRLRLSGLKAREVETRHGLMLSIAHILRTAWIQTSAISSGQFESELSRQAESLWSLYAGSDQPETKAFTNPTLRPALSSEGYFRLLSMLFTISDARVAQIQGPDQSALEQCIKHVEICSAIGDEMSLAEVCRAAAGLFASGFLPPSKLAELAEKWISDSQNWISHRLGTQAAAKGWLRILSRLFKYMDPERQRKSMRIFLDATTTRAGVEVRVAALQAIEFVLCSGGERVPEHIDQELISAISRCLGDFTTDQRGDVGSLVRVAALKCTSCLEFDWLQKNPEVTWSLLSLAYGLSVEKLDRVRTAARQCVLDIAQALPEHQEPQGYASPIDDLAGSSYFLEVLTFAFSHSDRLLVPTLTGMVTVVGGGSEIVLKAARTALQSFLLADQPERSLNILKALMIVLSMNMNEERLVPHVLAAITYVFETGALASYEATNSNPETFKELFALVQKSHLKSTSIPRLLAAVDIYTSLVAFGSSRTSCLKKLLIMLGHSFPLVRTRAAESLFYITNVDKILDTDWTQPLPKLKLEIQQLKVETLEGDSTKS